MMKPSVGMIKSFSINLSVFFSILLIQSSLQASSLKHVHKEPVNVLLESTSNWETSPNSSTNLLNNQKLSGQSIAINSVERKINGQVNGKFIQNSPTTWLEERPGQKARNWLELYRDQWSVYLKDENANIQLDVHKKAIYYWENHRKNSRRKLYDMGAYSNSSNGYMVTLVEHAKNGSSQKFGEFSRVGYKTWKEIDVNGLIFVLKEVRRDEWSVYLEDRSRNAYIQLDLHRKKVRYKKGNSSYQDLYSIISTYGFNEPAKSGVINFPGSTQSVTINGVKNILKKEGFTLVAKNELKEGECALVFPSADANDVSAQFGCMVCNARVNNELTMKYQVIHGKCDASRGGGACEVVVGKTEIVFDQGNGKKKTFGVSGPSASACASLDPNRMCADAGVKLGSVSFTDQNGNGVGVSLDAGLGLGLAQDYSDGVLSLGFDLKMGLGGSINLSVNLGEIANNPSSGLLQLAETGYLISGGVVRAAAGPVKSFFSTTLGDDVAVVPNTAISVVTDCPFDIVKWIFTQEDIDCLDSKENKTKKPSPNAIEYRVEIDNCHRDIDNEGTGNKITVEFLNGSRVVGKSEKNGVPENCVRGDATFSFYTNENITDIRVRTNGEDGFYIDELRIFKKGQQVRSHGMDDGKGWCLSTDPNDANGAWSGKCANGCRSSQTFTLAASKAKTTYKVAIDNCHRDIDNEGTGNKITVEFLNGSRVVGKSEKNGVPENCVSGDATFSFSTNENITDVRVRTNGEDGFYIDELRIFKNGQQVRSHGMDDGKGWCLSTDPNDANGAWSGKCANGCRSSQTFTLAAPKAKTTYKVAIDNCHRDIDNEGTGNKITVEFLNGSRLVGKSDKNGVPENCVSGDATFSFSTNENITDVRVRTNGEDGFYIDELRIFKNGQQVRSHGMDDGKGWCLSTDPNDANGAWSGKCANGCRSSQTFTLAASKAKTTYKVAIDNCHRDIDNEGTGNKITVEFLNGSKVVGRSSKNGVPENCTKSDATFSFSTSERITSVRIKTNGEDGFYIDELRLYKGSKEVRKHGGDDGNGWCLSTDPNDAKGAWSGKCSGTNQSCWSSATFKY